MRSGPRRRPTPRRRDHGLPSEAGADLNTAAEDPADDPLQDEFWGDLGEWPELEPAPERAPAEPRFHDDDTDAMASISERLGFGALDPFVTRVAAIVLIGLLIVPIVWASRDEAEETLAPVAEAAAPIEEPAQPVEETPEADGPPAIVEAVTAVTIDPTSLPIATVPEGSETVSALVANEAPTVSNTPDCGESYTVRSGDAWSLIADRASVSTRALLNVNAATSDSVIHPGDEICLPVGATTPAPSSPAVATPRCGDAYTVRSGDAWSLIADRASVTTSALLAANGANSSTLIHPGEEICLPPGARISVPATTTPPPTTTVAKPPAPSRTEAEAIIREIWPDDLEDEAVRIAWRESNHIATVENWCCLGLFQIYWNVHRGWLAGIGVTDRNQLFDARTNARAAYALYQRAGGWRPWQL